jgi:predicted RNase H-like nuclease (RuvC/YqgF family)
VEDNAGKALDKANKTSQDVDHYANLIGTQSEGLTKSAALTSQAIDMMRSSLDRTVTTLDNQVRDLKKNADQVEEATKAQEASTSRLSAMQSEIQASETEILKRQQQLSPAIDAAISKVDVLRDKADEISRFKTMEFVTLHAHSVAGITLQHVQEDANKSPETVSYDVVFATEGLRPLKINVFLNGRSSSYKNVDTDNKKPVREGLELPRFLRQIVKTQNALNGELSHGIVSTKVHS